MEGRDKGDLSPKFEQVFHDPSTLRAPDAHLDSWSSPWMKRVKKGSAADLNLV
jgi:hypothetical protein